MAGMSDTPLRSRSGLKSFVRACLAKYFHSARSESSAVASPLKNVQPPKAIAPKSKMAPAMTATFRPELHWLKVLAAALTSQQTRRLSMKTTSATQISCKIKLHYGSTARKNCSELLADMVREKTPSVL